MLFLLIGFETPTCITIWELFVILFPLQLRVCDVYLFNLLRSWLWSWFTEVYQDEWKYVRVNVLNGHSRTWTYIN
jgi:hypothetical protein